MKRSGRCTKCGATNLFHSPEVMDRGEGNVALPLAITRSGSIFAEDRGQLEVYVCLSCGFSEFYVKNPRELATLRDDAIPDDLLAPPPTESAIIVRALKRGKARGDETEEEEET